MKLKIIGALCFMLLCVYETEGARKRLRTSTTTEEPSENIELTLADREAALLDREESFRKREAVFREREEKLSQREDAFKQREDKLSQREKNIAAREQNTLKGKCGAEGADGAGPPPDYSVVRFDQDAMKLLDIGDIGACSDNMRFFAVPNNETEGRCDCDYHQCSRPLLYSDKYKQCFWAWSQGPCENNEWYTYDADLNPICEINPCPYSPAIGTPSYYFKSPEDSKCYKAGSKGPCKKKGERLFTIPDDPIPKCRTESLCPSQSIPAVQRCIPGNRRQFDGLCSKDGVEHEQDDAAEDESGSEQE